MDFEDAKENIQPLAAGRNASILQAALQTESPEELQQQRRQYEDAIEIYDGEDPLEPWFEYIYWIEQSFPSGGKESGLEEVLIKCLTKFEKDERYHQDRRMIKLYIKYVDSHEKPQECYQKLYHQGIGTMVADLYICWAYYYDLNGDFRSADQIFRKGIECKAQPLEELLEAHQHFGFTMSQRILYNDDRSKEKYQSSLQEKRNVLTSLKSHRKQVGSVRTGAAVKRLAPGTVQTKSTLVSQNQNSIQVFNEEQLPCSIPAAEYGAETSIVKTILDNTRNQENVKEAGPWSKACAKKKTLFTKEPRSDLGFKILEDQEDNLPIKGKLNYGKPFVYPENFVSCNEPQEHWNLPVTLENDSVKGLYPSYDKCLIYPKPNIEFSLEELGCYYFCKRNNIENKFTQKYDTIWKSTITSGIRTYPNFAKKNLKTDPVEPKKSNSDLFEQFASGNVTMPIDLKNYYPSDPEEEFQFEEMVYKQWRAGKRKLKYDINETIAMTEEMEETMCMPNDGPRRKSFFPTRTSIAPVPYTKQEPVQQKLKEIAEEQPRPSSYRKSIIKTPRTTEIPAQALQEESNKVFQIYEDTTENCALSFKTPLSPAIATSEQQKNNFQIYEDEENNFEANETCSTQVFNCFIKPHSISTPKGPAKVMKPTEASSERQPTNLNFSGIENIPVPANPNSIQTLALSPETENNDPGLTLRGKQLSTIMETSEQATGSTGSTKFSINAPDFDVEGQQSRMLFKGGNVWNMETVDKNKSTTEKHSNEKSMMKSLRQPKENSFAVLQQQNEISRLEQPEDTIPTMPAVRIFEDKTETVPKILFTKLRNVPEEKEEDLHSNSNSSIHAAVKQVHVSPKKQISPCRVNEDFFFNSEVGKNIPNSPLPAAVVNNSIFTSSAFMKFQDSPVSKRQCLNDSPVLSSFLPFPKSPVPKSQGFQDFPELNVKGSNMSDDNIPSMSFFTKDVTRDVKNKTSDSLFLPNVSKTTPTDIIISEKEQKKTMEKSFLPGFSNDMSTNRSPGKYKSTVDSFLSGFPSVAVGEQNPREDSFLSYLSGKGNLKNNQDGKNSKMTLDSQKTLNTTSTKQTESSVVGSKTEDRSFMSKQSLIADDKATNKQESFLLSFSKDLKTNSSLNMSKNRNDKTTTTPPFLSNDSSKFLIPDNDLLKKMSVLNLEANKTNVWTNSKADTVKHQEKQHSSSPQFKDATNSSHEFQFKADNFFEDNIRTEAFAVNLSMIKNSTLLPNQDPHQSQIQLKSINISDENVSCSPFSAPPTNSPLKLEVSDPQQKKASCSNEFIVITESDDEPEAFGKSIYYAKTPKTPKHTRHAWSTEAIEEYPENADYFYQQGDMDETQNLIDNFCLSRDINPFDKKLTDAFLVQVDIVSFIENLPSCKMVRNIVSLRKESTVEINGKVFSIIKLIGEGAFGAVFSAKESQTGKLYAMKQERPANLWEYYICLELQSRLHSTEMMPGFMKIECALIGNNASILCSKFSRYGCLITVCNKIKKETLKTVDEYVVMHIASQLLLIMDHLHASNIIHGDIKADNFLLMEKLVPGRKQPTIQLIDFGNSIDMNLFSKGQTFTYCHTEESFKCVEMLEKRPWTFQLDLFGLAGVIHVLLFGKYMQLLKKPTGWTHRTHIPRYFNKPLWDTIFHSLLNISDCQTMPNLQNLRAQLEEEIAENDKSVCQKIIQFNRALDS